MTNHENPFPPDGNPDQPHPHHIFPDSMLEALADEDPLTVMAFGETVLDGGVPLPYAAQVNTHFPGWEDRIRMREVDGLNEEIIATFDQCQQAYPSSSLWDGYRSFLAREHVLANGTDDAVELMATMQSQHAQARLAVDLAAFLDMTGRDGQSLILDKLLDAYTQAGNHGHLLGHIRTLADAYIDVDPSSQVVTELEAVLAEEDAFFDPLESWCDSQKIAHPELDWDSLSNVVKQDGHWADVPFTVRRSIVKEWGLAVYGCTARNFEPAASCMIRINECNQEFPQATMWQHLRITLLEASIADDDEPENG